MLLFTGGCLRAQTEEAVVVALPLNNSLPQAWEPLGPVQEINLDGDEAPEYLLFFTYDGPTGPVGAVIYDNRLGSGDGVAADESNRPSASLMPYPILPNYRADGGQGFIAEPAQKESIALYPLALRPPTTPEITTDETAVAPTPQADLLTILGGTNYITFVWWQPTQDSYGITQLYAPSHFETEEFQPFPWETWRATPTSIEQIVSVHPVRDRNLLCYRRLHTLTAPNLETLAADQPIGTIRYEETNLGLSFCSGTPSIPFYPEGVVLAYLLDNPALLDANLDEGVRQEIQAVVMPEEIVYVNDLAGYKTIRNISPEGTTTQVCAEVLRPGAFYLTHEMTVAANQQGDPIPFAQTDANVAPPYALQWLLFELRYEPFHLDPPPPQPDRLFITKVTVLPVPTRNIPLECRVQLGS